MSKNVWIINHYATIMYYDMAGRHYLFAKYLNNFDYKSNIFCANTFHNKRKHIDTNGKKYIQKSTNDALFTFVKTTNYKNNKFSRILNIVFFYLNLKSVMNKIIKREGKPDVIYASSVHPLSLLAGIQIGKKYDIPVICEIRDLWPQSFIAYSILKENSLLLKPLYAFEKWLYKKADQLIFTMEGGKQYIIDMKWDTLNNSVVDLNKVHYINNGVDLDIFRINSKNETIEDPDLENSKTFKIIYVGSIRRANKVNQLIDLAIKLKSVKDIMFLIYGEGNLKDSLENYADQNDLKNVIFKGKVEKKFIPFILTKANMNIILGESNCVLKYGFSANKLFDYIASGAPILQTFSVGYSIINKYGLGVEFDCFDLDSISNYIINYRKDEIINSQIIKENSRLASDNFDYRNLTTKLERIIKSVLEERYENM